MIFIATDGGRIGPKLTINVHAAAGRVATLPDTWRKDAQVRSAGKLRISSEIAGAGSGRGCGATVVQGIAGIVIRSSPGRVEIDDAIAQLAVGYAPSKLIGPVAGEGAIVQDGLS